MSDLCSIPVGNITDVMINLKMKVYPYPSQSIFKIQLSNSDRVTPIHLNIMDANGRIIEEFDRVNIDAVKEVGGYYSNGLYLIDAIQGRQRVVFKMVKGG